MYWPREGGLRGDCNRASAAPRQQPVRPMRRAQSQRAQDVESPWPGEGQDWHTGRCRRARDRKKKKNIPRISGRVPVAAETELVGGESSLCQAATGTHFVFWPVPGPRRRPPPAVPPCKLKAAERLHAHDQISDPPVAAASHEAGTHLASARAGHAGLDCARVGACLRHLFVFSQC
jgi:hypothetical protein